MLFKKIRRRNHSHEALNSNEPAIIDAVIGDEPPLPGKITYG
nr:hypothetical protein [Bacillus velezensis]